MKKYTLIAYRKHIGGWYSEHRRLENISLSKAISVIRIGFADFEKVELTEL